MLFSYTASARASARLLLIKGAVFTCLALTFAGVFWWTVVMPLLMLLPLIAGVAMLYDGLVRLLKGGVWQIEYDGERLSWQAPVFAEESFTAHNKDIAKIVAQVKVTHKRRSVVKRRVRYELITHIGDTYSLNTQSGADVTMLVGVMREQGVLVDEISLD